jgi:hypothetical protein
MAELPIVKKLCGAGQMEAATLIKEFVRDFEEIYMLSHTELMVNTDTVTRERLKQIKTLSKDALSHAKSN